MRELRLAMLMAAGIVVIAGILAIGRASTLGLSGDYVQSSPALRQLAAVPLPGVSGRIDHLAFDPARQRLFVAALGHNTVEVLDTVSHTHLRSLSGFHEPQGIAMVPEAGAIAVANGETGTLQLVDAETFARLAAP